MSSSKIIYLNKNDFLNSNNNSLTSSTNNPIMNGYPNTSYLNPIAAAAAVLNPATSIQGLVSSPLPLSPNATNTTSFTSINPKLNSKNYAGQNQETEKGKIYGFLLFFCLKNLNRTAVKVFV